MLNLKKGAAPPPWPGPGPSTQHLPLSFFHSKNSPRGNGSWGGQPGRHPSCCLVKVCQRPLWFQHTNDRYGPNEGLWHFWKRNNPLLSLADGEVFPGRGVRGGRGCKEQRRRRKLQRGPGLGEELEAREGRWVQGTLWPSSPGHSEWGKRSRGSTQQLKAVASLGCCDKLPQTWWLKAIEMCFFLLWSLEI